MSSNKSLKQEINEKFPRLAQDLGLRFVKDEFDPDVFGNSYVILDSSDFLVRFVRDRGQNSIEVASHDEPDTWWNLEDVCAIVSDRPIESSFDLETLVHLLQGCFSSLGTYLGPKISETKQKLAQLAAKRGEDLIRRFSS